MNLYWASAASFVFFIALGALGGKLFHLDGPGWYLFLGVMASLGLGSAAIFAYLQNRWQARRDAKASEAAAGGGAAGGASEIDVIREANTRLAQSKGASIANLPLIFVVGDRGTAKTSTLVNSGLEPELLAGQIYQDGVVAQTRTANLFFARDTVFVEAGGATLAQPGAWKNLITRLQPGRLKAAGGRGQAPRGVLLCFDLEAFARPGAAESIGNAARYLQERLGEVSQQLGISFPVYVLFTRADRVPFFADFVRNLSMDEAGQVVGATLPLRGSAAGGVYAEEEARRLGAAFNDLFHSFCDQRLRLLPREADTDKVPGAYEFPREFRKLRNLLVQFLVDVGRPSQLRASPFLRGFYFSGVRPVEVRDISAASQSPSQTASPAEKVSGATGMFRAGLQAERRAQQAVAQPGGSARKVPQWLFLGHLFHSVILADAAARAASGSSVKTSLAKRILLASSAGLCLLYSILLIISFFGNRSLENNALTAARNISAGEAAGANLASEDSLRRLDTLRQSLAQLTDYKLNGAPLHLRWGLYSGNDMLPQVRRVYYGKFRQLLFGSTQAQLLAFLQKAPATPAPSDDYGYAYDTLKTYLLTTSEWKRSSEQSLQSYLGSRLLARWDNGRDAEIGKERMDLAKLQFDFYARDLQNGNPYLAVSEAAAVDRARLYLSRFSGVERVYRFLLSEAAKRNPPANFNQKFPGTSEAVTSTVDVAWAFTRDGWTFMQDQIKRQNFGGEQWVLGNYQAQAVDQASMDKGILDLYRRDYVEQWRNVLRRSNVNKYSNLQDASRKLTILTSSQAPLLALFWWTSQNTAIDLPGVADRFRAVQAISPPSGVQQYIVPQNQTYNAGLMNLQQAVDKAANKDPDGERTSHENAQTATLTTRQLAATFAPDAEAHIEQRAEELLLQPIKFLDEVGSEDLRAGGARFCAAFNALTPKFPFNPTAQPEVTLDELGAFLRPKTGTLWTFYDSTLKNVMQCQNGDCTAKGSTPINPNFVRFVGQAMKFSRALYGEAGMDPNLQYTLKPQASDQVEEFDITINNQAAALKGGAQHMFSWPGPGPRNFRLSLKIAGGSQTDVGNWETLWSVFRFFADADTSKAAPGGYNFDWVVRLGRAGTPMQVKGRPLTYEFFVDTGGGPAVFSKDFLSTLKCTVPVAR